MRGFVRRRGRYIAELDATERSILARVVADTAMLLGDSPPDDGGTAADDGGPGPDAGGTGPDEGGTAPDGGPAAGGGAAGDADIWPGEGHGPARSAPHGTGADRESLEDQLSRLGKDVPEPTDPALARLLPAASRDDDELAAEFRRLTQEELRNDKIGRLRMVWAALRAPGTKLTIDPDRAMDWAAALTDVRLVLSERLDIRTDSDAEEVYALAGAPRTGQDSQEDDLRMAMASVYSAFTWLQESLVQVMLPTLED